MAAKKKYKKLTAAQKKMNQEVKTELRDMGILPPVKPKLNRKKFAKEVIKEYEGFPSGFEDYTYLLYAINSMLPFSTEKTKITPEQIGVLKIIKLSIEIKKFYEEKKALGEKQYKVSELFDNVINPIRML